MNPQEAVLTLIKADWSEARIGQKVGISQSTVNRVKLGKRSLKYEQGRDLIDLAREVTCPDSVNQMPSEARVASG
jgi:transcriptional regulator with XRE-family HTH domain